MSLISYYDYVLIIFLTGLRGYISIIPYNISKQTCYLHSFEFNNAYHPLIIDIKLIGTFCCCEVYSERYVAEKTTSEISDHVDHHGMLPAPGTVGILSLY